MNRLANAGKTFERLWRGSIPSSIWSYRLKDDTSGFLGVCNPCDFILFYKGRIYLQELKTHKGKSLPFSAITKGQWEGLYAASKYKGIKAGIVINFREYNKTFYVDIIELIRFRSKTNKKSINMDDLMEIGVVVISKKKRVQYTYCIEELLKVLQ